MTSTVMNLSLTKPQAVTVTTGDKIRFELNLEYGPTVAFSTVLTLILYSDNIQVINGREGLKVKVNVDFPATTVKASFPTIAFDYPIVEYNINPEKDEIIGISDASYGIEIKEGDAILPFYKENNLVIVENNQAGTDIHDLYSLLPSLMLVMVMSMMGGIMGNVEEPKKKRVKRVEEPDYYNDDEEDEEVVNA